MWSVLVIHDPLCENYNGTCCPWMGDCECQCMCEYIDTIRQDQIRRMSAFADKEGIVAVRLQNQQNDS